MRKYLKILLVCTIVCSAFLLLNNGISADVGNSFSGGGSSFGGSSSFGGGGSSFVFIGGVPGLVIALIIYFVFNYLKNKNGNVTENGGANESYVSRSVNEEGTVAAIKAIDPDFSAEKFKTFASEVYINLQESWEKRDWKGVRPLESNALFNVHERQLQEYIDNQKTPHLDMQNVHNVALASFKVDGNIEVLSVKLSASLLDYTTDDNSGKILEGSKTQFQNRVYHLEFIRTSGVKTDVQTGVNTTNCPNCGAPTKVTNAGECEYCGSVITNGEFGWVLNKYEKWY